MGANELSAIASAIAAGGSLFVAWMTYSHQRSINKQTEIDKVIDRLMALAVRANTSSATAQGSQRSFKQTADIVYAIDAAVLRIVLLKHKYSLPDIEQRDLKAYVINYLSYEIITQMRANELPLFEVDTLHDDSELLHIKSIWARCVSFLLHDKEPY